jgi:hypothetical protein
MNKLLAVATFAAVAFAVHSAAACDWNRQASTETPAVATAAPAAEPSQRAAITAPQPTSAAATESARKPIDVQAPVVLVTDRH